MIISRLLLQLLVAAQNPCVGGDTTDVARFFAQFIASLPATEKVPRGALVVVCENRFAFATGFGTMLNGNPVDPERTLFRAASNSKLITATAAMQLAASGRWKPADEVNSYLPPVAQLRPGFGRGVTIADLLTHTAGLEAKFAGSIVPSSQFVSLAEYFARNRPRRVSPAGGEISYSNTGMALVGYAVEAASGESFDHYADTHIFAPLGMKRSTFAQPIPTDWQENLASAPPKGARGIVFLPYPAASLVTTPNDMGRFIAAHTSRVATPLLPAEQRDDMHATHWRAQPSAPGVAYGFFEGEMNGHRTLFHTGDSGDHSVVFLLPGEQLGLYFVYSGSDEQTIVREKLVRAFMDRYFPARSSRRAPSVAQPLAALAGVFRGAGYSHSNYEKLKALFYQAIVSDGGDGTLAIRPPGGGAKVRLHPRATDVFTGDSGEVVAFRRNAKGTVVGFTLSGSIWDPQSFDRIGPLEDGRLHLAALMLVALAFVARISFAPLDAIVRRLRRRPKPVYSPAERRWWRWSGIVSMLALVTPLVGIGVAFLSFRPGAVAIPRAALVVGVWLTLVSLAGLPLVPATLAAWRRQLWSPSRRILFTSVAMGIVIGAPLLTYWKVLPF